MNSILSLNKQHRNEHNEIKNEAKHDFAFTVSIPSYSEQELERKEKKKSIEKKDKQKEKGNENEKDKKAKRKELERLERFEKRVKNDKMEPFEESLLDILIRDLVIFCFVLFYFVFTIVFFNNFSSFFQNEIDEIPFFDVSLPVGKN